MPGICANTRRKAHSSDLPSPSFVCMRRPRHRHSYCTMTLCPASTPAPSPSPTPTPPPTTTPPPPPPSRRRLLHYSCCYCCCCCQIHYHHLQHSWACRSSSIGGPNAAAPWPAASSNSLSSCARWVPGSRNARKTRKGSPRRIRVVTEATATKAPAPTQALRTWPAPGS